MRITKAVETFLFRHSDSSRPILLGFSGGVDSTALLFILQDLPQYYSRLHLAHIDHGWRSTSCREALALENLSKSLNLPFHLKVLGSMPDGVNKEDYCREKRIRYLIEWAKEIDAQAVALAHHADDQAETVLKRVLEGAPIEKLSGMKSMITRSEVPFWRPLIQVPKQDIVRYAKDLGVSWFDDATNRDARFLRARMRARLLPFLNQEFGKNVTTPLCRLADEFHTLNQYLAKKMSSLRPEKHVEESHICYDFSRAPPEDLFEWQYLVKEICNEEAFPLSRAQLKDIARLLQEKVSDKQFEAGGRHLKVSRQRLFFKKK